VSVNSGVGGGVGGAGWALPELGMPKSEIHMAAMSGASQKRRCTATSVRRRNHMTKTTKMKPAALAFKHKGRRLFRMSLLDSWLPYLYGL